jgi:hypothetical protein
LAQATHSIELLATLSSISWLFTIKASSFIIWKLLGVKGPRLFIKYGTKYVRERQALKENQPAVFEEGKDMLYRFMSLKHPETSQPLGTRILIKVAGHILCIHMT